MMMMSQVAQALDATLYGKDVMITGVSKDTRDIQAGDLYVALVGERFDGHQFVANARACGACGALVSNLPEEIKTQPHSRLWPQVLVKDTRKALGQLACHWRQTWGRQQLTGKLIGITGSNGKTSVKEMCRKILDDFAGADAVLSTKGNLNNEIGVPMMLLELRAQHKFAVIEMGANHVGEINYLTSLAKPDVAVVNNVGPAHLEGFGSLENTSRGKAEIYNGLAKDGVAIINLDDVFSPFWIKVNSNKKTLTFSMLDDTASVYAKNLSGNRYLIIIGNIIIGNAQADKEQAELTLKVPGDHNVMNALAAISLTLSVGVPLSSMVASLSTFENIKGRLTAVSLASGCRLIDDSYNANPASVAAAIDVLADMSGNKVLVLGDMYELGDKAEQIHSEIGAKAKDAGINYLYATGALSQNTVKAFGDDSDSGGFYFKDKKDLMNALNKNLSSRDVVLIKGSRGAAMDEVVAMVVTKQNNKSVN
jgi:UDP-N-acetylmuramoyl-tripeptide--D-alanyl-D-alanine ligase